MESIHRPYGLINLGNTCYMNTVLQTLFLCKEFNNDILLMEDKNKSLLSSYKVIVRRIIQRRIENSNVKKFKLTNFIESFRKKFQHVSFRQQDAHEALHYILQTFHENLREEFTDKLLKKNINNMRYNKKIKKECTKQIKIMYKNDYSLINKFFYGKLCNIITCGSKKCSNVVNRVEIYKGIELSIENETELVDCLGKHFSSEELEGYKCDECKEEKCNRRIKLLDTPKYLLITLKRFIPDYSTGQFNKNNKNINFPIYLHFTDFLLKENDNKKVKNSDLYKLTTIINHSGSSNNGHYYSYHNIHNNWLMCDDDEVSTIDEESIFTSDAYVLLFEKVDIIQ